MYCCLLVMCFTCVYIGHRGANLSTMRSESGVHGAVLDQRRRTSGLHQSPPLGMHGNLPIGKAL
eukprot:4462803-Amphidinium_carterae.1